MHPKAKWAAGVLAFASLTAGCRDGGDDATTTTTPPATTTTAEATTTTAPPEAKPLRIVEQGVSTFPDPIDPLATLGGYGVVIANPNKDLMATGVRVVTRVLDAAGTELLVDNALLNGVLPGQRMAVGRTLIEPIEHPTTLEVTVDVTAWLPPASPDGRLVAEEVVTEPEVEGGAVTRFKVRSTWPESEEGVDITALYRAEDGRILGAEPKILDVSTGKPTSGQIRLLSPIPDLARTEVYVGRGFAALTDG